MNTFPTYIDSNNINNFNTINLIRIKCCIREYIHDFLLNRKDDSVYVDLDMLCNKYNKKINIIQEIITDICLELKDLGWNTKLSYGDTGLFIYSTTEPPANCW
jgi:hypothetical protein